MNAGTIVVLAGMFFIPGCAARMSPAAVDPVPPPLILKHALPDDAEICVPLEVFRNEGVGCITVGELRALLRSRRNVAFQVEP